MRFLGVAIMLLVALSQPAAGQRILDSRLAVPFVESLCDLQSGCKDDYPQAIGILSALGAGTGAAVGAGIGLLTQSWGRRYP